MRITGWLLLVAGVLLCVSIVWATIGFLMMGFGLICLLIAEDRRKRAAATAAPSATAEALVIAEPSAAPTEPHFEDAWDRPPVAPPPLPKPRAGIASRANVVASAIEQVRQGHSSYDTATWDLLVMSDPDIARLVEVLAPYGRQYVDELAAAYLALNDKSYLSLIVDEIIASARRETETSRVREAAVNTPSAGTVRRSMASEVRPGRSREMLRAAGAPREPVVVSREPVTVNHEVVVPDVTPAPNADGNSAPVVVAATASEPEPAKTAAEAIVTVTPRPVAGTEAIRKNDLDDAKDLRDLFKAIGA